MSSPYLHVAQPRATHPLPMRHPPSHSSIKRLQWATKGHQSNRTRLTTAPSSTTAQHGIDRRVLTHSHFDRTFVHTGPNIPSSARSGHTDKNSTSMHTLFLKQAILWFLLSFRFCRQAVLWCMLWLVSFVSHLTFQTSPSFWFPPFFVINFMLIY